MLLVGAVFTLFTVIGPSDCDGEGGRVVWQGGAMLQATGVATNHFMIVADNV